MTIENRAGGNGTIATIMIPGPRARWRPAGTCRSQRGDPRWCRRWLRSGPVVDLIRWRRQRVRLQGWGGAREGPARL